MIDINLLQQLKKDPNIKNFDSSASYARYKMHK